MTLQETLDALKHTTEGKLYRKDRMVRFYEILSDTALGRPLDIHTVVLDDEGEITAILTPAIEDEDAPTRQHNDGEQVDSEIT